MFFSDFISITQWWSLIFIIGIFFLPITKKIFPNFIDNGYIFSKIIGIGLSAYTIFLLGSLHLVTFNQITSIIILIFFGIINWVIIDSNFFISVKNKWKIYLLEELIFFITLLFWSYIRSFQPEIHGLEKYMDFGFINSILRAEYFPPRDMWFTPYPINYYYFGHLVTAVLTKISAIPSFITYNLMLSTIFAFTFLASFSIGINLLSKIPTVKTKIFIGGILIAFLVSLGGNLHTIYSFFTPYQNESPIPFWQLVFSPQTFPNSYWYPNATRFIHNTIHEFPLYSFVVSDLHGHVLDIPFVLLVMAVLFSLISDTKKQFLNQTRKRISFLSLKNFKSFFTLNFDFRILLLSFILSIMYMTNVWDGAIYFFLTASTLFVLFLRDYKFKNQIYNFLFNIFFLSLGFFIFSLPFSLNFKPFVSGIGVLCAPSFFTEINRIGPLLFETDHCQKSPLWQFLILYGFFYFFAVTFIIKLKDLIKSSRNSKTFNFIENLKLKVNNLYTSDLFILLLIFLSTLIIIIPEFIYAKDIYPAHYRANTMFKLVYQSFIMLSIASGYIIIRLSSNTKSRKLNILSIVFLTFSILIFLLVSIYPYFAINSYYNNLKNYRGINGTNYLSTLYPTDYEAILWINKNIKSQPVILEAQGDSYTDYARISANTGLPTVLGWTVHEWLWRGTYDIPAPRISEVQTLYESNSLEQTKKLIKKYNISLIFIGDLERQKYLKINEEKFNSLGKIIYENKLTKIYKINFDSL